MNRFFARVHDAVVFLIEIIVWLAVAQLVVLGLAYLACWLATSCS